MQQRPAPRVTIEGGPGWQLQAAREQLRVETPARQGSPALWVLLLVAATVLALLWAGGRGADAPREADASTADPADAASLVLRAADVRFEPGKALMSVELVRNTTGPVAVVGVSTIPGLSVRLLGPDGQDLALPLDVADAEVEPAAAPTAGERLPQLLLAEVTLASCSDLPPFGQRYTGGTLVELRTEGPSGAASAFVGDRYPLLPRLRSQGC